MRRRRFLAGAGALGAAGVVPLVIAPAGRAAGWPDRPITAVVMYSAGEMAKSTGWTVNVVNKPGAVGGVATRFLLNKPDDGYWWLGAAGPSTRDGRDPQAMKQNSELSYFYAQPECYRPGLGHRIP